MSPESSSAVAEGGRWQPLKPGTAAALNAAIPAMADATVSAITDAVPEYREPFAGRMGEVITAAVQTSLTIVVADLTDTHDPRVDHPGARTDERFLEALAAAERLGRDEARRERNIPLLLAAYRVGARISWQQMSQILLQEHASPEQLSACAQWTFTFIDHLSSASVRGHQEYSAASERTRLRQLDRLARLLLAQATGETLALAMHSASWKAPRTLTAVVGPSHALGNLTALDPRTLLVEDELPEISTGVRLPDGLGVALVADSAGPSRARLSEILARHGATIGPARPWSEVALSYRRCVRAWLLLERRGQPPLAPVDTDSLLTDLVLEADPVARAELRAAHLAPLAELPEPTAARLEETLRAWLLLQGRREAVARHLQVHPQTVRYRMQQLRELFGSDLDNPDQVLALILALQPTAAAE